MTSVYFPRSGNGRVFVLFTDGFSAVAMVLMYLSHGMSLFKDVQASRKTCPMKLISLEGDFKLCALFLIYK